MDGRSSSVLTVEPTDSADVLSLVRTAAKAGTDVILLTPRRDSLAVTAALHNGARSYICVTAAEESAPAEPSPHPRTPLIPSPRPAALLALSERERQIVQGLANGLSNTDIGAALGISALTVKSHLARIGGKLQLGDRAAIVACVLRAGLIE